MKDGSLQTFDSPTFSKTTREWFLSSALYDGIEDEDLRQIEILLAVKGANPNILLAEYGISPFHLAVANDNTAFSLQATDICLRHGADPNVRSEDGLTPVHLAAMWGCQEILHVLLASGGDPWLVDCLGLNAFNYALKYKQQTCYDILKRFTNSQPELPSQSPLSYQLNLKRVILYKNDLQIVYESSPSRPQRCVSTQTVRNEPRPCVAEGLDKKDTKNSLTCKKLSNNEQRNAVENSKCTTVTQVKSQINLDNVCTEEIKSDINVNECDGLDITNFISVNNKLKEIMFRHRVNSTVFEYSPKEDKEVGSSNSKKTSCKDTMNNCEEIIGGSSELFKKLDETKKYRQSLKVMEKQRDIMKNVTQRKKLFYSSEQSLGVLTEESLSNSSLDQSTEYPNDTSSKCKQDISTETHEFVPSPDRDLSPSIGFILDNLESTSCQTRGSSLFSDIASDIEVVTNAERENIQNVDDIMTEDETSLKQTRYSKHSSSESLCHYVSCDDASTMESGTNERFESCLDKFPTRNESKNRSVSSEVHSLVESILNNIDSENKTPVNPNIVTSTPERSTYGSDDKSSSTPSTIPISAVKQKQKWVEAHISSSEEEPYLSISEEYEYTDLEEGVVLIEKRHLAGDIRISTNTKEQTKSGVGSSTSEESEVSTISGSEGAYDTDELRKALQQCGYPLGPITGNTKRVYLRRLKRLRLRPKPPTVPDQPGERFDLAFPYTPP